MTTSYEYPYYYLLITNIIGDLGAILNIFTLALIIVATPKYMKRYKYYLMTMQFFSTTFDLLIHLLKVELYLPVMAVRFYGPLYTVFDTNVTAIGFLIIWGMVGGTAMCFLHRHRQVLPPGHWLRFKIRTWAVIILVHPFPYWSSGLLAIFSFPFEHPPNASGLPKLLEDFPQRAYLQDELDTWIGDPNVLLPLPFLKISCLNALLISIMCAVFEFLSLLLIFIYHSFYMLKANSYLSEDTRKRHKTLIWALIWQAVIPVMTIAFPFSLMGLLSLLGKTIPQEVLNMNNLSVTLHGKICSILIIALTHPYRKFCVRHLKRLIGAPQHFIQRMNSRPRSKLFLQEIRT